MSFGLLAFASPKDFAGASGLSAADALVVAPADARAARERLVPDGPRLLVVLPPVDDAANRGAVAAALAAGAVDVLLAGAASAADVVVLDARLGVAEARLGLPHGSTGIVALAAGSARGVLALSGFRAAGLRLRALAFDRDGLAADVAALDTAAATDHAAIALLLAARAASVGAVAGFAGEGEAVAEALAAERRGYAGTLVRDIATALAVAEALRR